jgi:hypothetical protein
MKTLLYFALAAAAALPATAQTWSVTSPNGKVKITVQMADLVGTADYPKGNRLYYRVEHGAEGNREVVVHDSPLGLQLQGRGFLDALQFVSAQPPQQIDERYQMPHGKRLVCQNRGQQATLTFRNAANQLLEVDLRAYDDGAAFRYRLPEKDGGTQTFAMEATGFALPKDAKLWMAPNERASLYTPAYEAFYENGVSVGAPSPTAVGWAFPVLFQTAGGRWGLITESSVSPDFCGSRLTSTASQGVYRVALPDPADGNGHGVVQPSAALPWTMPWRLIVVGDSPAAVVESTLVTDVAPPSSIQDTSWIHPGRVAWSWWSDPPSPQDGAKQKKFIDLAAEMGWEYLLVDANWDLMDNGNVHDVLRYAKEKGVGVFLWYNSGGPHNVVTEKPRDCLTAPDVRRFELQLLKKWGVRGIKVDFFQSEKQEVISLYHGIMKDAADAGLLVDFHGCMAPRGWERQWPNLMSMEAVRGAEQYIFDPTYPERAPVQNTIIPFARNAIGPMDFTPVTFSDNQYPHRTTAAHELALSVVFESGLLHLADKAEAYLGLPEAPREFLKHVPVVWDDTRFIAGYPGQFVILARRHGETWYVAGINGQGKPLEQSVKFGNWLSAGRYELALIADGPEARTFAAGKQTIESAKGFNVKMLPYGGFAATLKPAK